MTKVRAAPGGGRVVEVEPHRLTGWLNRFAGRNGGIAEVTATLSSITVRAGNDTTALLAVPFAPMRLDGDEPVAALLAHLAGRGTLAVVLVRGGAFSVGLCRDGVVTQSSTDARYLQGRTAAGGWSQQRYQRRRGNQRREAQQAAAATAQRVCEPASSRIRGVVAGGDPASVRAVLDDARLAFLRGLPHRSFPDIAEPRRTVLDEVAARSLSVEITVRDGESRSGT